MTDEHPEIITSLPDITEYTAIGIGPGIGEKQKQPPYWKNYFPRVKSLSS